MVMLCQQDIITLSPPNCDSILFKLILQVEMLKWKQKRSIVTAPCPVSSFYLSLILIQGPRMLLTRMPHFRHFSRKKFLIFFLFFSCARAAVN